MLSNSGIENQNPAGSEGRMGKGTQKRRPQRQKVKKSHKATSTITFKDN